MAADQCSIRFWSLVCKPCHVGIAQKLAFGRRNPALSSDILDRVQMFSIVRL